MAGQITPFGSVLTIMDVHNCLDDPSLDLGVLCTHTRINPWSLHKPINYYRSDGAALTESDWACHSGFKTSAGTGIFTSLNALVYEPPVNDSVHRRYRLSDFWYYNHNARRPSCVYANLAILDTQSYNGYVDASIAIDLPSTDVLKALAADSTYAVNADILLICEYSSNGFVVMTTNDTTNSVGSTAVRDGYNLAIYSLDGISETNYRISTSVRLNLYNKVVANKYSTTLYYLYGRRSQGNYGSWYIPGGESIYIDVKIISTGVNVQATISPIDGFPPAGISNNDSVNERGTLDATNHTFRFEYLELIGPVKSTAVNNFGNFKGLLSQGNYGTKWVLQYRVWDNNNGSWVNSMDWTNIPTPTYLNAEINFDYSTQVGTFRVYLSSVTIPNCSAGRTVNIRIQYLNESLYWNYTS